MMRNAQALICRDCGYETTKWHGWTFSCHIPCHADTDGSLPAIGHNFEAVEVAPDPLLGCRKCAGDTEAEDGDCTACWPADRRRFVFAAEDVDDRGQRLNVERVEVVAESPEEAAAVMAESFPGWRVKAVAA